MDNESHRGQDNSGQVSAVLKELYFGEFDIPIYSVACAAVVRESTEIDA